MKIKTILMQFLASLLILAVLLFAPGCAALKNPTTQQRVATACKVAAYVGGTEYLRTHPESRPAFVIARDELKVLENADTIDFTVLLAIVNQLPVKELKSERATLIISAATILLSDYAGSLPADQTGQLKTVAKSLREGLDLALGQ